MEYYNIYCKTIVLGESGVGGKTSLISRFVNDLSFEKSMSITQTSFSSKILKLKEINVKFEILDTPGQKRYKPLAKVLCRKSGAIIFAYDITKKETFSEIKKFWYPEIKKNCESDPSKIKQLL